MTLLPSTRYLWRTLQFPAGGHGIHHATAHLLAYPSTCLTLASTFPASFAKLLLAGGHGLQVQTSLHFTFALTCLDVTFNVTGGYGLHRGHRPGPAQLPVRARQRCRAAVVQRVHDRLLPVWPPDADRAVWC
jgi:hypothetical protein